VGALSRATTARRIRSAPGTLGLRAVALALLCHPATAAAQGALFPGGFEIGYVHARAVRPDTSGWGNGLFVRMVFEPPGKRISVGLEVHGWRQRIPQRGVGGDSAFVQRGDLIAQVRAHVLQPGDCARARNCALEFTLAPFLGVGYGVRDDAGGPVGAAGAEFDLRLGHERFRPYGVRAGVALYAQGHRAPAGLRPSWLFFIGAAFRFSERR